MLEQWVFRIHYYLLRLRRCFENAKPRRSAGGAQLNRSLGELEGPIRDPVLARFPKVAAFSSAESGSGEPPDRAQICAMMMSVTCLKLCFFLSRFWDRQNGILVVETRKSQSKKWIAPVMWPRTVPNLGPEADLDWFRKAFEISQTGCSGGRPR